MNAKCDQCRTLSFRDPEKEIPSLRGARTLIHILHRTKESWLQSISAGCHFCTLARGQVYNTPITSPICDALGAFVVLAITVFAGHDPANDLRLTVMIMSKLGNAALKRIEDLEQIYSTALDGYIKSACDSPGSNSRGSRPIFNARLAQMWRDECVANHRRCQRGPGNNQPQLPTRLLDISDPARPLLRESAPLVAQGGTTEYVALSYCWGEGKKFLTLKSNYATFTTLGISSHDLPRTFRDAVHSASSIGYQFIWIDALCIVQDDPADLQRELKIMGDIYRYAALTICAQGAASSHSGLFESSRHPLSIAPCSVELLIYTNPQNATVVQATLAGTVNSMDYLVSRGWILQEDILTSRALRFGSQMSWRCMEAFRTETEPALSRSLASEVSSPNFQRLGPTSPTLDPFKTIRAWLYTSSAIDIPENTPAPGQDVVSPHSNHLSSWYIMVQLYSYKDLSFSSDILRALLGIAAIFRDTYHISYLAGLWKEDLLSGLSWYIFANDPRPVVLSGPVSSAAATLKSNPHPAPSWTWASVGKVRIHFACMGGGLNFDTLRRRSRRKNREVLDAFCAWDDPINEAKPPIGGGKVPGQLWSLRLRTRAKKLVLRRSTVYAAWRTKNRTYGARDIKDLEFESLKTAEGIYPRFPGQLLDLEDDTAVVGEAALDFGPQVDLARIQIRSSTAPRDGNLDELVKWNSAAGLGNARSSPALQCLEVTCLLLDTYEFVRDWYDVCLIVVPRMEGSTSFTRIGLGFLPREEGQDPGSRPDWEDVDCEIV